MNYWALNLSALRRARKKTDTLTVALSFRAESSGSGVEGESPLQCLGKFLRESTLRRGDFTGLPVLFSTPAGPILRFLYLAGGYLASGGRLPGDDLSFGPGRLGAVRAQDAIFERRSIKPPDYCVHFVAIGRINESEAFGFLGFRITNHFDSVGNKVLGLKPGPDVVGCHPGGKVAEKNGITHVMRSSLRGELADQCDRRRSIAKQLHHNTGKQL